MLVTKNKLQTAIAKNSDVNGAVANKYNINFLNDFISRNHIIEGKQVMSVDHALSYCRVLDDAGNLALKGWCTYSGKYYFATEAKALAQAIDDGYDDIEEAYHEYGALWCEFIG